MEMQNWCRPLWKMEKMAVAPQKRILEQNLELPTPPKVWVSSFPSVNGNAGKLETQTLGGLVILSFALGCVFGELRPFFPFSIMANTNFVF